MRYSLYFLVFFAIIFFAKNPLANANSNYYIPPDEDSNLVFTFVETPPQFIGGDEARMKYLSENIKYPDIAKDSNIQGVVYIAFVVERDGSISNVRVIRGIGGGCDEEAMRVIKMMPNWTPGIQRGKPVRANFTIPIKFTLSGNESENRREGRKRKALKGVVETNKVRTFAIKDIQQ